VTDATAPNLSFRERVRTRSGTAELLLFRVGRERFALELRGVEEALDIGGIALHDVPRRSTSMLGILPLRDALVPLYAAAGPLGVSDADVNTALVFRRGGGRVALAVTDAEDVLTLDLENVRPAPHGDDADGVLLGVLQLGKDLIGIVESEALLALCRADPSLERP
jgi:chemotaxis signal transduction protein